MLRKVELFTAEGEYVATVELLPFQDHLMPKVVIWGIRTFVAVPEAPGAPLRYHECFAALSRTPPPGLPREQAAAPAAEEPSP